ncbi:MAG: hypothetical protein ACLFUM_06740, partial [Spirochaetaceae bacterium]
GGPSGHGGDSSSTYRNIAGEDALDPIRAELGNAAVTRARLSREHFPEERFRFEPVDRVYRPAAKLPEVPRLVRRFTGGETPLPSPDPCRLDGPFIISGHWWRRGTEMRRAYHYLRLPDGQTLWVYYDEAARHWIRQGSVD